MSATPQGDPLGICGTVVGEKYRPDYVVGEGGFSVVYRAEHIIWKQPVALKCFKALANVPQSVREDLLQGFIQEGKLMTSLSSRTAAIVQARDVGTFTTPQGLSVPYMVLEWLEGRSLDHVLHSENSAGLRPRTLEEAMGLLEPIVSALETVHQMNIAHRDVKPANLFIIGDARGPSPFVKILDFGIAKVMAEHAQLQTALAQTGQEITAFTPNYGAPEQFSRSHGATGPWTDVFALALILVEMVRGAPALQGNDYLQLAVASRDPMVRPTPRALGVAVPDAVEAVFAKALAVSPRDRYRTAGELWIELRRAVFPNQPTWVPATGAASTTNPRASISVRPPPSPATAHLERAPTVRTDPATAAAVASQTAPAKSGGAPVGILLGVVGALALGGIGATAYFFSKGGTSLRGGAASATALTGSASAPASASASAAPPGPEGCPKGMAFIPGGKFFMGSDSAEMKIASPSHKVTLSPYCMDIYEVTAGDYKACSDKGECKRAATTPDYPKGEKQSDDDYKKKIAAYAEFCNAGKTGRESHPINCVTWEQADNYCKVHGARLPTEAEWEFAARGSDGRKFPWGDEIGNDKDHMNAAGSEWNAWEKSKGFEPSDTMFQQDDGFAGTAPVGSFKKGVTQFGLYDMVGNVWEWTQDWFASYQPGEATNPTGAPTGDRKAIRGGAFNGGYDAWLDPAYRYFMVATASSHGIGFRCAKGF
jgi:formylglycine-generating enzyme required for sulfatase activity/serine/threonine protein kinase